MAFKLPTIDALQGDVLAAQLRSKNDGKIMSLRALGQQGSLAHRLSMVHGSEEQTLHSPQLLVCAADHGIAVRGVSAYPGGATWRMVGNFLAVGAAVRVLARQHGITQTVVDCGVRYDFAPAPGLIIRRIAAGTQDPSAFHEDGLADTADGLGGYVARERTLEIMKDSRIGTYGTVTLGLALMLKVLLLALIAQRGAWGVAVALLAAHALSRLAPLVVIRTMPYVSDPDQSKSKPLADSLTGQEFRVACWWSLPALMLLLQAHGVAHLLLALVLWVAALAYMMRLLRQRLQGFTGDTLGATQQLCELAIYLALAMQWA